ncbi:MAG: metallophosphatase family protein [Alphaproteobacteria bacterium]|nr:metallophosphatase family protein [Alphaproteobacteria bacterium]
MEKYIRNPTFLVLSDIQFGPFGPNIHNTEDAGEANLYETASNLAKPFLRSLSSPGSIDLIVLAGDIVSTGSKLEFQAARIFLDIILGQNDRWNREERTPILTPDGVIMCPGNHDIDRAASAFPTTRFGNYLSFARDFYLDYWGSYSCNKILMAPWLSTPETFLVEEKPILSTEECHARDIWTIYSFGKTLGLQILALNSAEEITWRQSTEGKWEISPKGAHGFVAEDQLLAVRDGCEKLGLQTSATPTVAVLHHNLIHGRRFGRDASGYFALTENYLEVANHLQRWNTDILIHGHQHEPFTTLYQQQDSHAIRQSLSANARGTEKEPYVPDGSPLLIVGTGSFAASQSELPESCPNRFHILKLEVGDPTTRNVAICETYHRGTAVRFSIGPTPVGRRHRVLAAVADKGRGLI